MRLFVCYMGQKSLQKGGSMKFQPEEITSRQNPYIGYVCKLSEKKHRDSEKKFRFDGIKLFSEAVECGVPIESVLFTENSLKKISPIIEKLDKSVSLKQISDSVLSKVSEEKSPEGVICVAKHIDKIHKIITINNSEGENELGDAHDFSIFLLESVRDPGNLGTVIRTAAAFGVDCLILSNDCADIYNPKTIRAAMGTLFHQRIIRADDLCGVIDVLSKQERRIYAATLGSRAAILGEAQLERRDCIVVGNEGHGLSKRAIEACSDKIFIPMVPGTESLNAAVASSICLWEQFGRICIKEHN